MPNMPTVSTSGEDYLEAILRLTDEKGVARVRDIAAAVSVHKSTVSISLKNLAEKGLVNYAPYENATLTPRGKKVAEDICRRHGIIRDFFINVLALDEDIADSNACRAEHVLDGEVLQRLAAFAQFMSECPDARQKCLKNFQSFFTRWSKQPAHKKRKT